MKKQLLSLATIMAVTLAMTSCGSGDSANKDEDTTVVMTDTATPPAEEGVMVGGSMMVPSKNIVENAMGSSEHTTLVAAVQAAGLGETLSGAGPFTVFAPTNMAFDEVGKDKLDNLMKPENKEKLAKVLTYHVVPGAFKASDLSDGQKLKTVEGKELKVTIKDGKMMIDGAEVLIPDVVSSNGVTHVINKVLMP
jgi:uncharacterized surface protein with fasciclin (FAS1) repeats